MKLIGMTAYVDDVPAELDFYRRAFGLKMRFFDPEYQYGDLDCGGGMVLGVGSHKLGAVLLRGGYQRQSPAELPHGTEVAFATDDVPGAFARAVAEGAAVVEPPRVVFGMTLAFVRSPGGTLVVLCPPPPAA